MVPSVGATEGISTTPLSRAISPSPPTRPRIAVVIGSAIATAVPNASRRMITAAAMPIASLSCVLGCDSSWPR